MRRAGVRGCVDQTCGGAASYADRPDSGLTAAILRIITLIVGGLPWLLICAPRVTPMGGLSPTPGTGRQRIRLDDRDYV